MLRVNFKGQELKSETSSAARPHHIITETLLRHIAESDQVVEETRNNAKRDLEHLQKVLGFAKNPHQGGTVEIVFSNIESVLKFYR